MSKNHMTVGELLQYIKDNNVDLESELWFYNEDCSEFSFEAPIGGYSSIFAEKEIIFFPIDNVQIKVKDIFLHITEQFSDYELFFNYIDKDNKNVKLTINEYHHNAEKKMFSLIWA